MIRKYLADRALRRQGIQHAAHAYRAFTDAVDKIRFSILDMIRGGNGKEYLQYFKGWVYSCIMARADGLADLVWSVKVRSYAAQGGSTLAPAAHWLVRLKENPNPLPWVTWKSIIKSIEYWQSITGEAYLWTPAVGGSAKPNQIWIIPPMLIKPVGGGNDAILSHFEMTTPRGIVRIPKENMIYLPLLGPSPDLVGSVMRGVSRVGAAIDVVEVEHYIHGYLRSYFAKHAVPEFIVESEGGAEMYSADWEQFLARWLEKHQGMTPGTPMGYLPAGWKLREINTTANKETLLGMAEKNLVSILGVFKVPKGILTGEYDSKAPATSFRAMKYTFQAGTLAPLAGEIAEVWTRWARLHDPTVTIEIEPIEWKDPDVTQKDELHRLSTGRATINNLREENGEDLLPPELGDVIFFGSPPIPLLLVISGGNKSTPPTTESPPPNITTESSS